LTQVPPNNRDTTTSGSMKAPTPIVDGFDGAWMTLRIKLGILTETGGRIMEVSSWSGRMALAQRCGDLW
jgi:hypothetical protein